MRQIFQEDPQDFDLPFVPAGSVDAPTAPRGHSRVARLLVIVLVGSLMQFFAVPAAFANHGTRDLEVAPDLQRNVTVGSTTTVTARLLNPASPTATSTADPGQPIKIDFEIESGPTVTVVTGSAGAPGSGAASDGNTPNSPDMTCTVTNPDASCEIGFSSTMTGTNIIRAWIDHDGSDSGPLEADTQEGRFAGPTDCTQPEDTDSQCSAAAPTPGDTADPERDDTDVFEKRWISGLAARLDCDDASGDDTEVNPVGASETYTCTVQDAFGNPKADHNVDYEVSGTANDPDNSDFNQGGGNSDDTGGAGLDQFCSDPNDTDSSGRCSGSVSGGEGQAGTSEICFWVDESGSPTGPQPPPDNQFEPGGFDADGGDCDAETVGEQENNDLTDTAEKTWQNPSAAQGGLDVQLETATNDVGVNHTVTATVYDQFGQPFSGFTTVKFEFFQGSVSDRSGGGAGAAGNTPSDPDGNCTTNNSPNCTFTWTQTQTSGLDLVCAWTDSAPPTMTGTATDAMAVCDDPDANVPQEPRQDPTSDDGTPSPANDSVDVVRKSWGIPVATRLDCEDDDAGPNPTTDDPNTAGAQHSHSVACTIFDQFGEPFTGGGVRIDGEFTAGPNNPDGMLGAIHPVDIDNCGGGPGTGTTSGNGASCTYTYSSNGNAGNDVICFFMDTDNDNQYLEALGPEDGGDCDNEKGNPPQDDADTTDAVRKQWAARVASKLNVEPETASNALPVDRTHTLTATVRDQFDALFSGANVDFIITGGPNATPTATTRQFECTTGSDGTCQASYSSNGRNGTDEICGWIDTDNDNAFSSNGGPEDGGDCDAETPEESPESNDVTDRVKKTWEPPSGLAIDLTCESARPGDTRDEGDRAVETTIDCVNPTSRQDVTFTAFVFDPGSSAVSEDDVPQSGVLVEFTITNESQSDIGFVPPGGGSNGPVECMTGSDGRCSRVVRNPSPADGERVDVLAEIAGQTNAGPRGNNQDQATKEWQTRRASSLDLEPAGDQNLVKTTHTVTATVRDQFGDLVTGTNVDFQVTGRNSSGSAGFDRTTDGQGRATFTYTDTGSATQTGTDTVRAWADVANQNDMDDGASEPDDFATKRWVTEILPVETVKLDMQMDDNLNTDDCPDTVTSTAWNDNASNPNALETTHELCAAAFDEDGEVILGQEVTFTITSGPGFFTNASGNDLGRQITVSGDEEGHAHTAITSRQPGTTVVRAEAQGETDSGNKPWEQLPPRTIDCDPETATNDSGTSHTVTCVARDRLGNPVSETAVTWSESGPGSLQSTETQTAADGTARATVATSEDEVGDQTITGSLARTSALDECERAANNPQGAPAGVCSDDVTKTWIQPAEPPPPPPSGDQGYWFVASDGGVFTFGRAQFHGSTGGIPLNSPIVAMDSFPTGEGYWMFAADGGVFSFGKSRFFGSTGSLKLNRPIVGGAATPSGQGYWLVASDGGVFAFGDAAFHGSTGSIPLNSPIVGMASTRTGRGYWLFAADGGVFAFGDAAFHGSTGSLKLVSSIVGADNTASSGGYWEVAGDGGVFAFGDADFFGSTGSLVLNSRIVGLSGTPSDKGYWFVGGDGGIFAFGDAQFHGSTGSLVLNRPIVGMEGLGS